MTGPRIIPNAAKKLVPDSGRPGPKPSAATRLALWTQAAGRCQFEGCNTPLLGDLIAGARHLRTGYVAHIVSAGMQGPRCDPALSIQLSDDISNLMLLCDPHHIHIDENEIAFPVDRLRMMKRVHEETVARLLDTMGAPRTTILRYGARIGDLDSPISEEETIRAVMPRFIPASWSSISIALSGFETKDHDPSFWTTQRDNLRLSFARQVTARVEEGSLRHLSVFALAPIPLLVELGRLIGDKLAVDVRQLARDPKGWAWPNDRPEGEFKLREPNSLHETIALKIGVSATVTDERIHVALGDRVSIWSIEVDNPNNDFVRSEGDVARFGAAFHAALDRIKARHGDRREINVFPAIPVSLSVELGRRWMPKADLPLMIWDQNARTGGSSPALRIEA